MSYEPIRAVKVFEAVVRSQGHDPAIVTYTAAERARVADLVNEALGRAWRFAMWPQLLIVKKVTYRAAWSATETYAADDEVFYRNADDVPVYYRCLKADTGTVPGTDATVWEVPEDFLAGIRYCEHFIDALDLEFGVFEENPDLRAEPRAFRCVATHYGCAVADPVKSAPAEPWLRYRPMPPDFSWTDWAIATAYEAGDVVFHEEQSWVCLADDTGTEPGTDSDVWRYVSFPRMFLPYVVAYAAGMRMQDDDGKAAAVARAERLLEELEEQRVWQPRGRRRVRVRVC